MDSTLACRVEGPGFKSWSRFFFFRSDKIDKVKMKNRCYTFKTCIADFNSAPNIVYLELKKVIPEQDQNIAYFQIRTPVTWFVSC